MLIRMTRALTAAQHSARGAPARSLDSLTRLADPHADPIQGGSSMSPESVPAAPASTSVPRLGVGTIVRHFQFGLGRIVAYEPGQYVIVFRGGDTRRVAWTFDALEVEEKKGDPETDRIRQAVRDVLGEHGWIDVDLE